MLVLMTSLPKSIECGFRNQRSSIFPIRTSKEAQLFPLKTFTKKVFCFFFSISVNVTGSVSGRNSLFTLFLFRRVVQQVRKACKTCYSGVSQLEFPFPSIHAKETTQPYTSMLQQSQPFLHLKTELTKAVLTPAVPLFHVERP